jgi:renalase
MKRIAIIGAGLSGLVLAQKLSKKADVTVFEKANGLGGRMSTRYALPFVFDHGAPCFTARSDEFYAFLKPHIDAGTIAPWQGEVITLEIGKKEERHLWHESHLVPLPNMNSLCHALSGDLNIRPRCEVAPLGSQTGSGWELHDKNEQRLGYFDWVISTAPPAQTVQLLAAQVSETDAIRSMNMQSCFALLLGFNRPWTKKWIFANVRNNPIKYIAVNSSKPSRNSNLTCLVIHTQSHWANAHIDHDINEMQHFLLQEFNRVTDINAQQADYISTHRWRYSTVGETPKPSHYINWEQGLAATSDWCASSHIEQVWFAANKLAELMLAAL